MIASLLVLALSPLAATIPGSSGSASPGPGPIGPPPPPAPAAGVGTYGSDGTDGVLSVPAGTTMTIDLGSQGTYLGDEWVVRFDYVSVDIQGTVEFLNHPSRAPVAWIVQGDVNIANGAVVSLDGTDGTLGHSGSFGYAEPGPGGFRGGKSSMSGIADDGSAGFGPGGAKGNPSDGAYSGSGGSYRTYGGTGWDGSSEAVAGPYGGPAVFQLIGGSGGGASRHTGSPGYLLGGGAGGGAILIAADGRIDVEGVLRADGGAGRSYDGGGAQVNSAGGSGGAVRLASLVEVAVQPTGIIQVSGGLGGTSGGRFGGTGGFGRARIESPAGNPSILGSIPPETSIGEPQPAFRMTPPRLWIASIGTQATPPQGGLTAGLGLNGEPADMQLVEPGMVDIVVESQDLPLDSLVFLRITRAQGHADVLGPVTLTAGTSVTFTDVNLSYGFLAMQARAVLPQP